MQWRLWISSELRDLVEETAKQLKNYDHDIEHLKIQLKDSMHEVEKCLQQGKLVTMGEVKSEIKERCVPPFSMIWILRYDHESWESCTKGQTALLHLDFVLEPLLEEDFVQFLCLCFLFLFSRVGRARALSLFVLST